MAKGKKLRKTITLLVLILFMGGCSMKKDQVSENPVFNYLYGNETDSCFYNLSGDVYKPEYRFRTVSFFGTAADSSLIAYYCYVETENNRHDLYYITGDLEPMLIAENVRDCMVSYDGSYIAYEQEGDLYLYQVDGGRAVKIDDDVYFAFLCLSPDGKTVAYQKWLDNETTLYMSGPDGEVSKIAEGNAVPLAVSNDASFLYYLCDDTFYYWNGEETVKIASDISIIEAYRFYFNRDISEVLYLTDFATYYYTPEFTAPVKVADERARWLISDGEDVKIFQSSMYALTVGRDTLQGCVLEYYSGLYLLNEDVSGIVNIIPSAYQYQFSQDGKSLLYLEDGTLYRIDNFRSELKPQVVYGDGFVDYFTASDDLSKIYIAMENELYYLKDKGDAVQLSDDFEYPFVYAKKSGKIFFLENGVLYQADEQSKEKVGENVERLEKLQDGIVYQCSESGGYAVCYLRGELKKQILPVD